MKVLITGVAGQLGSHLAFELAKLSWMELLMSDKTVLDITDAEQVDAYFKKNLPDIVVNTAAFTSVDFAEKAPSQAISVNHIGAANLARSSAQYNCAMIQLSTDYIFDGGSNRPYVEDDLPRPLNIYGVSKLEGERVVMQYNSKHIILRTSWLFSDSGKNFYLTMQNLLKAKKSISVVNDQFGAPTFVLDLVNTIRKILEMLNQQKILGWGVYHYAGYPFTSWFDFAKEIQKAIHPKGIGCEILGISTDLYGSTASRPLYSCLDSSKAFNNFAVEPSDWIMRLKEIAIKTKN